MIFPKNIRIGILILLVLTFHSCLKDDLNQANKFEGPSEYDIEFQSGSFTGRTFHLISNTLYHDHEYLLSEGIQKILSKPLQDKLLTNLNTSSFINWAWQGDTISGQFTAIFATDLTISKSGDLQMIFTNGDEFISSIPKGAPIEVEAYGGPEGAIEGSFVFTSDLDYKISGISKRETISIYIHFKIKRGPTL